MKRFNYDKRIEEQCKRRMLIDSIGVFLGLIMFPVFFSQYSNLSSWEKNKTGGMLVFLIIVMVLCMVISFVSLMAESVRMSCLKTNYLEIESDKISGVVCKNLKDASNIDYFSLTCDEIEKVESKIVNKNSYYTLFIHTKRGTYKLCVENAEEAKRYIETLKSDGVYEQLAKNDAHKWRCSCGKMISTKFCPFCGKDYTVKDISQEGLKKYIQNELEMKNRDANTLEIFQMYMDCMYKEIDRRTAIEQLGKVIQQGPDVVDYEYIPVLIESCNKRLNELNTWRCVGCGKLLDNNIKRCECGYKNPNVAETQTMASKFCIECGNGLPENSKFCSNCGKAV